tara:strand:+ start:5275 stop:5553 length:279 start_codon:yes stop_codon:yes gene_type:complete
MEGFDNSSYYSLEQTDEKMYKINNNITIKDGKRDYKNNCNISLETPEISNSQNVLWGSQKPIKETCPNIRSLNETPVHYAWNNFTKRISIVE